MLEDRIEFTNPGLSTIAPDVLLTSTEDLEPKYSRNQRLIEVMSLSRLNQRKGSGVRRIRETLEANGSYLKDGSIGLKLWNDVEKCRFHLVIYRRDLTHLTGKTVSVDAKAVITPADISRIIKYAPVELIGREAETKLLDDAWDRVAGDERSEPPAESASPTGGSLRSTPATHSPTTQVTQPRPRVLTFVALGGEGKTSLVAKWLAELAGRDWPGCDAVFAWSFYSQGTREQVAASSDLFLTEALTFFGDAAMAGSKQDARDKGRRLAQLVGERRVLLILDGLEPLQYAPTSPTPGELRDQGLAALLTGLAVSSRGLCVVTTRYSIPDLRAFWNSPLAPASTSGQGTGEEPVAHGNRSGTAPEVPLLRLSREHGVKLLKTLGVRGSERRGSALTEPNALASGPVAPEPANPMPAASAVGSQEPLNEFEALVEEVHGHALTLNLLGSYLRDAHGGDIRRRDLIRLEEADDEEQGGHAFRVMDAYANWFETGGKSAAENEKGNRALALLRLLGLFDRPVDAGCLGALLQPPAIPGLTDPLSGTSDAQRNLAIGRLEDAKLLTVNREPGTGVVLALDAHPLIREYFATELKTRSVSEDATAADSSSLTLRVTNAYRLGHRRLYEHLCASTQEGDQPTLEALQPLYQAVVHGCHAGLQQEVNDKVFFARIKNGNDLYSMRKLGAFGSDLGATACFFESPWTRVSPALKETTQAVLLDYAAFCLRALGRLTEALEPMRATGEMGIEQNDWNGAAINYSNLSELELTLGAVAEAAGDASRSVTYADRSGDAFQRYSKRTTHADALHQAGRRSEAEARFREAEQMQAERQPAYPLLYSLQGFRYCDLLLAAPERAAWEAHTKARGHEDKLSAFVPSCEILDELKEGQRRAAQTLDWWMNQFTNASLLDIALDHLTLGRAALYEAILDAGPVPAGRSEPATHAQHPDGRWEPALREIEQAVSGLRSAGTTHHLPRALLTRAWQRFLAGARTGPESAQSDLDEAWEIAARGPMLLFMADVHLHRARLFGTPLPASPQRGEEQFEYPWDSPATDLAAAEKLINKHGYHRRDEELADAKAALLG